MVEEKGTGGKQERGSKTMDERGRKWERGVYWLGKYKLVFQNKSVHKLVGTLVGKGWEERKKRQ